MVADVINDGMGLELNELSSASGPAPLLEAFWHSDGNRFDFRCHGATNLPFEVVERFVTEARRRLPAP